MVERVNIGFLKMLHEWHESDPRRVLHEFAIGANPRDGVESMREVEVSLHAASAGLDRLGDRTGLSKVGRGTLSALVGTVVYVLILVTTLTMALDKLALDVVSDPLQGVLAQILEAVPKLLVAAFVLAVAWVVGKLVAGLVADLLARLGFDRLFVVLGLSKDDEDPAPDAWTPSRVAGRIVLIAVMLVAVTTAAEQLQYTALAEMFDALVKEGAGWFRALLFLGLGLWIANFTARVIRDRDTANSGTFATIARVAIIVLAAAVALGEVEVGKGIVEQAFGYAIGGLALGVALAFGLSFGLGGREAAARKLDRWQSRDDGGEPGADD